VGGGYFWFRIEINFYELFYYPGRTPWEGFFSLVNIINHSKFNKNLKGGVLRDPAIQGIN
jgi:hypothetical protein